MNHWPFVVAAYAVTGMGAAALCLWAQVAMRRAERRADAITRR